MVTRAGHAYPPIPSIEGWITGALGLLGLAAGWWLGWIEATVVGVAGVLALILSLPFVLVRLKVDVDRHLDAERVVAGEVVRAYLEFHNLGRSPTAPRVIDELIDGERRRLMVPSVAVGATVSVPYEIETTQRGVLSVGPTIVTQSDPLALLVREYDQSGVNPLWVHPRTVRVSPLPVGFAKDLDGPSSDTSPSGDIAFHAVRQYEPGDSHRHVHWMSTAKTGTLMVRQHVDTRRLQLTVVLDSSNAIGDSFELGIEVAASIGAAMLETGQGATVVVGPKPVARAQNWEPPGRFLDQMAVVERVPAPLEAVCRGALGIDGMASAMVIITGGVEREDLLPLVKPLRTHLQPIVVRLWPEAVADSGRFRGMPLIDASTLDMFQLAWQDLAR